MQPKERHKAQLWDRSPVEQMSLDSVALHLLPRCSSLLHQCVARILGFGRHALQVAHDGHREGGQQRLTIAGL